MLTLFRVILIILFFGETVYSAVEAGQAKEGKQIIRDYKYCRNNVIANILLLLGVLLLW